MMPPAPLTIHLFGPLRVLVHGKPLPRLRTRSVEWLLALLVLRQGLPVERAWLAGTLWIDSRQSQALKNLRNDLTQLRTALGPEDGRIQSPTRDTLTLDLEGAEVDLLAFDAAIEKGGEAGDEESLRSLVALYTGPLLEGCDEPWALPERERREQACLTALERLAEAAKEREDFAGALDLLRRAEAMDPLSDSVQRRLMRTLAASGDAPAALIAYRGHRLRLLSEMNVEPDEETTRLFQQIRTHAHKPAQSPEQQARRPAPGAAATVAAAPPPTALPHPLTQLIGREHEVQDVAEQLSASRLVTLAGAGGVGKTRLAIEVARNRAGDFADGALFVPLASLADPALVPAFVAAALGLREEIAREPVEALVGWLSPRSVLLVLDNCEHLIEAAAQLTHALLSRCPTLRILATSRQRLGLIGEVVCRVPSLPAPDPERLRLKENELDKESYVRQYAAAQLFLERSTMTLPGFRLAGREEALAVAQVCRRLDGIPLAIELAAARVGLLSVTQIAARLDDRFRLLTGGSRADLPRHQTLRALIDWSYDQLRAEEQALLCRLSVFAGGWTLEAAEAIGGDIELLGSLADKSLVLAERQATGLLRYRMLETVREYAREKLNDSGDEEEARARHADYYLTLAEQARPFLAKPEPDWLDRLETEHDNVRATLAYYSGREETIDRAVWVASSLERFWNLRGHYYERRTWLVGLARRPTPRTMARAELLEGATHVIASDGDFAGAKQLLTESLAIWRELGDRIRIAGTLNGLAGLTGNPDVAGAHYDVVTARELAEEGLAIMRELGDLQGMAHSLYLLGRLARQSGDESEAHARWLECRALDREKGVKGGLVLRDLGELTLQSGDYAAARGYFQTFLSERQEVGERWGVWWSLQGLGKLSLLQGEPERAARLLGASLAVRESIAHPVSRHDRAAYARWREELQQAPDAAALSSAWEEGHAMTLEGAARYALGGTSD
jgi:non-specific serine/threonine protein kinase